jgi:light-regulated signal transduction histidine kinase (bacteriophytochrome)
VAITQAAGLARNNDSTIRASALSVIFRAFQRADESRTDGLGLGLGLFIVKRAADLLGHRVEVRSVEGRGSCFTVVANAAALPRERGSIGSLGRVGCLEGLSYCLSDQHPAP